MKKVLLLVFALLLAAGAFAQSEEDFVIRINSDETVTITAYNGLLTDVVIPETIDGMTVTAIGRAETSLIWGEFVFNNKKLNSVVIPDTVTVIGNLAFANNNLTEITLPSSLIFIGTYAFLNNKIKSITIPSKVVLVDVFAFQNNPLTDLTLNRSFRSNGAGFIGPFSDSPITRITVPANITELVFERNFESSLVDFWKSQDRAAGTYVKHGSVWTKETTETETE